MVMLFVNVFSGFTSTRREVVAVHPSALVTVTEYVVFTVGDTLTVAFVPNPLLHEKVVPAVAVSEADSPVQISTVAGLMFAVGFGFTSTNRDAVAVQPSVLVTVTV